MLAFTWILVCGFFLIGVESSMINPIITTSNGDVVGKVEPGLIVSYEAFYGIPFAKPPIGPLRFKNPEPVQNWNGIYNARYERKACAQINFLDPRAKPEGSEDCLYLNIFRPKKFNQAVLPVLIYIHGGGLFAGSADKTVYGPEYLMDTQEVILVTIQYRLSIFGFLSSGDENCPGNFGLKDQNMALKWVKANIERFGGNPNDITLAGESAGGISVHWHVISKQSNELFNKAIILSGNALGHYAFNSDPEPVFREYAGHLNIDGASDRSKADIMKEILMKDSKELLLSTTKMRRASDLQIIFKPVIENGTDNRFVTEDPKNVWSRGDYTLMPMLFGIMGFEGGLFSKMVLNPIERENTNQDIDLILSILLEIPQDQAPKLREYYFNNASEITDENQREFLKIFADGFFVYPLYKTFQQHLTNKSPDEAPVTMYNFNFTSKFSMSYLISGHPVYLGACHADDLLYFFKAKAFGQNYAEESEEMKAARNYINLIVDFVKGRVAQENICQKPDIETDFCPYTLFNRNDDGFLQISQEKQFDLNMVNVWNSIRENSSL